MTRTYVLTLREMPRSSNRQSANRLIAHREKKEWQQRFLAEMMVSKVKRGMTHCNVSIEVRWKTRNHRDWHNYFHGVIKPLADALVSGNYLPDDTGDELSIDTPFVLVTPETWGSTLSKVELVIKLEATYPEE
jgi:hypothetical protein